MAVRGGGWNLLGYYQTMIEYEDETQHRTRTREKTREGRERSTHQYSSDPLTMTVLSGDALFPSPSGFGRACAVHALELEVESGPKAMVSRKIRASWRRKGREVGHRVARSFAEAGGMREVGVGEVEGEGEGVRRR